MLAVAMIIASSLFGRQDTPALSTPGEPSLLIGNVPLHLEMTEHDALARLQPACTVRKNLSGWDAKCAEGIEAKIEVEDGRVLGLALFWPLEDNPSPDVILRQLALALAEGTCLVRTDSYTFERTPRSLLSFDCGSSIVTLGTSGMGKVVQAAVSVRKVR
jgi:hypothetical protein